MDERLRPHAPPAPNGGPLVSVKESKMIPQHKRSPLTPAKKVFIHSKTASSFSTLFRISRHIAIFDIYSILTLRKIGMRIVRFLA
jgi:hypothetical protein